MTDVEQQPIEHAPPERPASRAAADLPPAPPRQPRPTLITYIERGTEPEAVESRSRER